MTLTPIKTIVILAAGQGTRFGGAKQFAQFGSANRTLMEYNLHHAISTGINRVIFVIQAKHQEQLTTQIINQLPSTVTAHIAFQDGSNLPSGCKISASRTKPLGTAHALWCAKSLIQDPFIVINADDYYGQHAFLLAQRHHNNAALLVGYLLEKTLSQHGGVNRGICNLSTNNHLDSITEIENIQPNIDNSLIGFNNGQRVQLAKNSIASMNFWCLAPSIFSAIEQLLITTLIDEKSKTKECYLPEAVDYLRHHNRAQISVLTSQDQWFGVTYAADSNWVDEAITALSSKGVLPY